MAEPILHNQDFYGWIQQQILLLQEGRLEELDRENLLEELADLGRSEKRALTSQMARLCCHLLKWHYQPARRSRSWVLTIRGARQEIQSLLRDNPSLKGQLAELFADGYARGRLLALDETGLGDSIIPEVASFTFEEAMEEAIAWESNP
ncbi:DUF29 domain-containing protein [Spirulina sp. CCNP1310]|uniref:DUF29 domain-containing protein n=1 Tax=Spirulina sp. CCNP1310 TaxID=3110249 RepID=UPI002B20369F|nr:DUF29 domain-containing protein [Spirulina sp. CCNP1310]MEA5419044.1 DUF29 domain-containing protein [Spirulina sp. CCNP1310]